MAFDPFSNSKYPTENKSFTGYVVDHKIVNGLTCYKVMCPAIHGKNVTPDKLPWVMASTGDESGASTSPVAFDKGQMVFFNKDIGTGGTGQGRITGAPTPNLAKDVNMPGNTSLVKSLGILELQLSKRGIRLPPDISKTTNANGVEVVEIVEKSKEFFHRINENLPTNGITNLTKGPLIPQLKNLPTALQAAENVFSNFESMLPGSSISPTDLLSSMTKAQKKELYATLPKKMQDVLESVLYAIPGSNSIRCDLPTFITNVLKTLKNTTNYDDLFSKLEDLLVNPNNHGLSELTNNEIDIDTVFGSIKKSIDVDGNITDKIPSSVSDLADLFGSAVSSIPSAESTLFSSINTSLPGMISRLSSDMQSRVKELLEKQPGRVTTDVDNTK